MEKTEIAIHR